MFAEKWKAGVNTFSMGLGEGTGLPCDLKMKFDIKHQFFGIWKLSVFFAVFGQMQRCCLLSFQLLPTAELASKQIMALMKNTKICLF